MIVLCPFVLSPSTACKAGAQDKLRLAAVEGRIPNAVATCFDFAQHERVVMMGAL